MPRYAPLRGSSGKKKRKLVDTSRVARRIVDTSKVARRVVNKGAKVNPAEQARYEIDVSLNPGKQSDTAKALELRKALKGKMTPLEDATKDLLDDEPTVIGTDPKKKFAKLREERRIDRALSRYIKILNKHGHGSKQDKAFILKVLKRGDVKLLEECNLAKQIRNLLAAGKLKARMIRPTKDKNKLG